MVANWVAQWTWTHLLPALAGRRALNQVVFIFAREGTSDLAWLPKEPYELVVRRANEL